MINSSLLMYDYISGIVYDYPELKTSELYAYFGYNFETDGCIWITEYHKGGIPLNEYVLLKLFHNIGDVSHIATKYVCKNIKNTKHTAIHIKISGYHKFINLSHKLSKPFVLSNLLFNCMKKINTLECVYINIVPSCNFDTIIPLFADILNVNKNISKFGINGIEKKILTEHIDNFLNTIKNNKKILHHYFYKNNIPYDVFILIESYIYHNYGMHNVISIFTYKKYKCRFPYVWKTIIT